jgi:hypothetical protein
LFRSPAVVAWADTVRVAQFYFSAISVLELEPGALRMERRDARKPLLDPRKL